MNEHKKEMTFDDLMESDFLDLGSGDDTFDPFEQEVPTDQSNILADEYPSINETAASLTLLPRKEDDSERLMPSNVAEAKAARAENISALQFNPLAAAVNAADDKNTKAGAASIFAKPAVFSYGGANEPIADETLTFEQLRVAKAEDFPELEEGKKVSWSMEYGKITKQVLKPKETIIQKLKEEIETSKEFLEAVKKSKDKDKDFICKVKPRITAQSKGEISAYKGVFTSIEEAVKSNKTIQIVPARDGKIYEIRCTETGRFVVPIDQVKELSEVSAGFFPALPPIPFSLISQIIAFFRHFMRETELEALVHIYWDKQEQEYNVFVPYQQVGKARVDASLSEENMPDSDRYIHFADVHSHNSMAAKFSAVDDMDERATRVYMVIGCLDRYFPEISVRISCGGKYLPISLDTVVDGFTADFPHHWADYVKHCNNLTSKVKVANIWNALSPIHIGEEY